MIVQVPRSKRHRPPLGLLVFIVIMLLVVAFGLFKRKGARKPPPPPVESGVGADPAAPAVMAARADQGHGRIFLRE